MSITAQEFKGLALGRKVNGKKEPIKKPNTKGAYVSKKQKEKIVPWQTPGQRDPFPI